MGACSIWYDLEIEIIAMRKIVLFILALTLSANTFALEISDSARISLLTCEPSSGAVYTYFGHTSIRVQDTTRNIDWVFNYGVFSFDQPYFIPKFIKGETDYELGISYTDMFLQNYRRRGSTVYEQVLNLTTEEKQQLWHSLMLNYEPENRLYRYNFIFDNCATRPCDMLAMCCDGELVYGGHLKRTTYRKLIEEHVGNDTWLKFGIDLLIGSDADSPIGLNNEDLFLPTHVKQKIALAVVVGDDEIRPLLASEEIYEAEKREEIQLPSALRPTAICSFVLLISLLIFFVEKRTKRYAYWFDSMLFSVVGIVGVVIFYLMFFSEHPLVERNWNLLWVNPLQLIFGIAIWCKRIRPQLVYYQQFNCIFLVAALIMFVVKIQAFHIAFMPIVAMLLIRALLYILNHKKSVRK